MSRLLGRSLNQRVALVAIMIRCWKSKILLPWLKRIFSSLQRLVNRKEDNPFTRRWEFRRGSFGADISDCGTKTTTTRVATLFDSVFYLLAHGSIPKRAHALILVDERATNDPLEASPIIFVSSEVTPSGAQCLVIKPIYGLEMLPINASSLHEIKHAQAVVH
ncbi:hypothetical protein D8674_021661 [Pyrus ussuriensis x Pyrus communis]|uniref:Uncharacterized protein n=1 Tax=Pyrus ussuriensis x Pyrus communis TaxID=2448454 RepID=A0A5N5GJP5_9ROSA|nr:hypothetical protein D8674_021661 [Pyrus ussuriensis x Pyrus communis]